MKIRLPRVSKLSIRLVILGILCIGVNVALCHTTTTYCLPLYFDTVGTIFMAFVGGALPAITVAVATSLACSTFSIDAIYFALLGVFVALRASYLHSDKIDPKKLLCMSGDLAIITGILGTAFQWLLLGEPQYAYVTDTAGILAGRNKTLLFLASMLLVICFNFIDKSLSVVLSLFLYHLMPEKMKIQLKHSRWFQKPLTKEEVKKIGSSMREGSMSLKVKVSILLVSLVFAITMIIGVVSARTNYDYMMQEGRKVATDVAQYTATTLDTNFFEKFMQDKQNVSGYGNAKYLQYNKQLQTIKEKFEDIEYLYVCEMRRDACYFIFDTDETFQNEGVVGDKLEYDEQYKELIPDFLKGKEIETQEVDSSYGLFITAYEPIKDYRGNPTPYYVGADVSLENYDDYVRNYYIRVALASSGFFALIIAYGIWMSAYHLVYPIGRLDSSIGNFMKNLADQDNLDNCVKDLESIDIHTDDELEQLYRAVCDMANQTADQIRSIRMLIRTNERMQSGLIVTMADIIENQSIDSKAHIQKTAEYVRIILEGLKRKGYYAEKMTDKFMNDVEMSAPLYDIGKVKIPEAILNKPGKLTDEENEIMKTHTTVGKRILENAISTVEGENYLKEARNMAAYHHENWDGSGFPIGLHGEVIPLSARIMAIADSFDELTSSRVYKDAVSPQEALEEIKKASGRKFDPRCVEVFEESFTEVRGVLRKYPDR